MNKFADFTACVCIWNLKRYESNSRLGDIKQPELLDTNYQIMNTPNYHKSARQRKSKNRDKDKDKDNNNSVDTKASYQRYQRMSLRLLYPLLPKINEEVVEHDDRIVMVHRSLQR